MHATVATIEEIAPRSNRVQINTPEAVLAVTSGSPEGLVIRIQAARLESRDGAAKLLLGELMVALRPTFTRVAGRFPPGIRGSVQLEDLKQVAAMEAIRFVEKYDHTLATTRAPFRDHVYRRALSACEEHVRMHSADVHVSDWQSRGRQKTVEGGNVTHLVSAAEKNADRPQVSSRDEPVGGTTSKDTDVSSRYVREQEQETVTPEALLIDADSNDAVKKAIDSLAGFRAKLIRQVYGIGCAQKSVAQLADELHMPRRRLDETLKAGLADLAKKLKEIA